MTVKRFMELGVLLSPLNADKTVDKTPEPRQKIYSTDLPPLIYKGRWQHEVLTVGF